MKQNRAAARAVYMAAFERQLKIVCDVCGYVFPAGRIEWDSPTYHYLSGHTVEEAVAGYIKSHNLES